MSHTPELPFDVLLQIFLENANMYDELPNDQAFHRTVRSSQFCRLWRRTAINSPPLWGRVIDLTALRRVHNDWAREILCRTGTAPLYIKGNISSNVLSQFGWSSPQLDFIHLLLRDEWFRVRVFDIHPRSYSAMFSTSIMDFLCHPAPLLQIFQVHLQYWPGSNIKPSNTLFAANAPLLRTYKYPAYAIPPDSSWLAHLSHLTLSCYMNYESMFNTLGKTPLLETLVLEDTFPSQLRPAEPKIYLPRLRRIDFLNTDHENLKFMDAIEPALGCLVIFEDSAS